MQEEAPTTQITSPEIQHDISIVETILRDHPSCRMIWRHALRASMARSMVAQTPGRKKVRKKLDVRLDGVSSLDNFTVRGRSDISAENRATLDSTVAHLLQLLSEHSTQPRREKCNPFA